MKLNLNESKDPCVKKYSPYLILAEKYCIKKGWFTTDKTTGHPVVEPEDMWQAIINIRAYENRNRRTKIRKEE
jgi:hypothetical protein